MPQHRLVAVAALAASASLAAIATRAAPDPNAERGAPGQPPPSVQARYAAFSGSSYDAATREVDLVLATGVRVKRFWFSEELDMSASAVDLSRVPLNQCRLLFGHDQADPIGVLFDVRLEAGSLVGRARFNDTPRGLEVAGMVERGELTGVSIGYAVKLWRNVEILDDGHEIWRAIEWELLEGSIVSVPADPHAGVRSVSRVESPGVPETEEDDMTIRSATGVAAAALAGAALAAAETQSAPVTEAVRAAPGTDAVPAARALTGAELLDAQARASAVGVTLENADLTRASSDPVSAINAVILERAAARQDGNALPAFSAGRSGEVGAQEREAVIEVLAARMTQRAPAASAGELRGYRVADLIALRGAIRSRDPHEIMQRAMLTTSDFPLLLEAAANKALLAAYGIATPTYRKVAARRRFADFKAHKFLRIGEFPSLIALGEGGEVQAGSIAESRETVSASTVGRLLKLSRKMIVNDDLGAFGDLVVAAGRAAARYENRAFYTLLAANGAMSDTVAMFHASHGNLAAAGTVIDVTNLGKARAAMRKQKNIGADEILNLNPAILLVGPDKELEAQQVTAPVNQTQTDKVNPFSGKLEVVCDAEIGTSNVWYLFADPADAPNFIYGYVGDAEGPMITQETPFGVDGVGLQILHDFGVGQIDFRGGYKNPGA